MESFDLFFQIIILICSVVVHEISHGYAARAQGDVTAEYAGRLTLNPFVHLDLFGSFIVPLISSLAGGFIIGWAKPVPYNPYNLKFRRWGEALVAAAGPASNLLIALVFGLIIRFGMDSLSPSFIAVAALITYINILLAVFNLVPIPPLDGSKILFSVLPARFGALRNTLERYGFFFALIFIFFLWQFVAPIVTSIFTLIAGIS